MTHDVSPLFFRMSSRSVDMPPGRIKHVTASCDSNTMVQAAFRWGRAVCFVFGEVGASTHPTGYGRWRYSCWSHSSPWNIGALPQLGAYSPSWT